LGCSPHQEDRYSSRSFNHQLIVKSESCARKRDVPKMKYPTRLLTTAIVLIIASACGGGDLDTKYEREVDGLLRSFDDTAAECLTDGCIRGLLSQLRDDLTAVRSSGHYMFDTHDKLDRAIRLLYSGIGSVNDREPTFQKARSDERNFQKARSDWYARAALPP